MENRVVIRFAMTKGEGDYPAGDEFSEEEVADIRETAKFYLTYDAAELSDLIIEECLVLYDGITRSVKLDCGLYFEDGNLLGYPSPIIEFKLSRPVDAEIFRESVWTSSFFVNPASRIANDTEPFIFEDFNGYASVICNADIDELIESLKELNLLSVKSFKLDELVNGVPCSAMKPI